MESARREDDVKTTTRFSTDRAERTARRRAKIASVKRKIQR